MNERNEHEILVRIGDVALPGTLGIPDGARGLVVFSHGSGSSRHSPRNRSVAASLREAGLATLLFDLLTDEEEALDRVTAEHRFNIRLLAERVVGTIDWLQQAALTSELRIGLFGSSTGAAAALVAAAARPYQVGAVVSRGGRPDLAGDALGMVAAPTLLLVGGRDLEVLELNRDALLRLHGRKELRIVPGATHLFSEPGALERVAQEAASFFTRELLAGPAEVHPPV